MLMTLLFFCDFDNINNAEETECRKKGYRKNGHKKKGHRKNGHGIKGTGKMGTGKKGTNGKVGKNGTLQKKRQV